MVICRRTVDHPASRRGELVGMFRSDAGWSWWAGGLFVFGLEGSQQGGNLGVGDGVPGGT
jgi:hypothetical protein